MLINRLKVKSGRSVRGKFGNLALAGNLRFRAAGELRSSRIASRIQFTRVRNEGMPRSIQRISAKPVQLMRAPSSRSKQDQPRRLSIKLRHSSLVQRRYSPARTRFLNSSEAESWNVTGNTVPGEGRGGGEGGKGEANPRAPFAGSLEPQSRALRMATTGGAICVSFNKRATWSLN